MSETLTYSYQVLVNPATGTVTSVTSEYSADNSAAISTTGVLYGGEGVTVATGTLHGSFTYVGVVKDSSGDVVGFLAKSSSGYYALFSDTLSTYPASTTYTVDASAGIGDTSADNWNLASGQAVAFCFMAGTGVRTPDGDVAVEALKIGDPVTLSDGRIAPVTWIGIQTVSTIFADPVRVLPVRIKAGALGDAMPQRDLLVSPDHALLIDDRILIHAGALVNDVSILRETDVPSVFTYYHVEVADHALILAENVPAETFVDNADRMAFDNWAEHEALYGDTPSISEMEYPRAKAHRQVPQAIRNRLLTRGIALYGVALAATA
jgi:hypothetical protein